MVGSALNLEYKSHGARRTRGLHKLLRAAGLCVRSMPRRGRGGDNSIVCVGTQLCVPSKVIERKIHKIRKAEDKVRER